MNAAAHPLTTAKLSQEVRIVGRNYGSLLGPEFKVAVGDRYFWIGELTLKLLKSGYSPDELGLFEIDPDDEPEDDRPINHTAAMRRAGAFSR
jgi:hypothetical protein